MLMPLTVTLPSSKVLIEIGARPRHTNQTSPHAARLRKVADMDLKVEDNADWAVQSLWAQCFDVTTSQAQVP